MQSTPQTSICHLYATGNISVTPRCKAAKELLLCSPSSRRKEGPLTACWRRLTSALSRVVYKRQTASPRRHHHHHHYYSGHLDDYRLLQELGCGGSATVYAASYRPRASLVALKQVDLDRYRISDKEITALRREIHILSRCHHPHIIPILRSFTVSHHMYLVVPMMTGSCRDLLTDFCPDGLEESLIACILKQTVSGLRYLHINGVIHRDVKAANILVDQAGIVKLADFGASIVVTNDDDEYDGTMTQQQAADSAATKFLNIPNQTSAPCRSFVGTPCWMAPEMIEHREYDEKVDIWALGITAIELACGTPPFCDDTAANIFSRVVHEPPPGLPRQQSAGLHNFVSKCLQKDMHARISADRALHDPFIVSAPPPAHLAAWMRTLQYPAASYDGMSSMASLQADYNDDEDDEDPAPTTPDDIVAPALQHIRNRNLLLYTPKEFHLF